MKTKNKKRLKFLSIGLFAILPLTLASCSTVTSRTQLLNKSIDISDGNNLDSNISLQNYAKFALQSQDGMKAYVDNIANSLILDWFKRASTDSNSYEYRVLYNNEIQSVDDAWDDTVDNYKKSNSSTDEIKIQQNELDSNGGTIDSYKHKKLTDWALSQFKDYLFKTSYLTFKDSSGNIVKDPTSASISELYDALGKGNFLFAYPSEATTEETSNTIDINKEYADFMNYVWQKYVEIENPYVVNMSLWKYGTPIQGISDLYIGLSDSTSSGNSDSSSSSSSSTSSSITTQSSISTRDSSSDSSDSDSGSSGDSSTVLTSGSYTHPYFGNDSSSPNTGTITKFYNFVNSAKNTASSKTNPTIPFKSSYDTNNYGLLSIPTDYTDDSSTYILAKNGTIYSDLYPEFAAASSYLFWRNANKTTAGGSKDGTSSSSKVIFANGATGAGITSIDNLIQNQINVNSISNDTTTGLDQITKMFVSTTPFFTSTSNGNAASAAAEGATTTVNGYDYQLKLSKDYVSKVINSKGSLKNIANKDLYVIDAFIPSNDNLTNFMFLRNQAGVHAISIDGAYYINSTQDSSSGLTKTITTTDANTTTNSASVKKQRAGQVVLFRSLLNNITNKPQNYSFSVDVQSELQTFFENNLSWLVLSYAIENNSDATSSATKLTNSSSTSTNNKQKLFVLKDVMDTSSNAYKAAVAMNNLLHEQSYYNSVYNYNNTLVKQKYTYSQNYGNDATKNGLAAPWVFKYFDATSTTTSVAESPQNYNADRYRLNPYIALEVAATVDVVNNPYETTNEKTITKNPDGSSYSSVSDVNNAIDALVTELKPLSSDYEGFKYRQYIYTDSEFVNFALIGFNTGDNLKNLSELYYLNKYIGNFYDFKKLSFSTSAAQLMGTSLTSELDNALANYFYSSTFDASTYKWDRLSQSDNQLWSTFNSSKTNTVDAEAVVEDYPTKLLTSLNTYKKKLWTMSVETMSSSAISSYLSLLTTIASIKYLTENDYKNFLDYVTSQNKVGSDLYVVWENSQNTLLQKSSQTSGNNLISYSSNNFYRNINNNFYSDYFGSSALTSSAKEVTIEENAQTNSDKIKTVTDNTLTNTVYADSSTSYYNVVAGMVGFKGFQSSSSNSLNTLISKRLFSDPKTDNKNNTGILYSYINVETLKSLIQNAVTVSDINEIAKDLGSKLDQASITQIGNDKDKTISEKKEELLNAVSKLSDSSSNSSGGTVLIGDIFKQRKGLVADGASSATTKNGLISDNSPIQYSAYAVQLNHNDLKTINALKTALKSSSTSQSEEAATQTTTPSITDSNVNDVIANLVVQEAMQTTVQTNMLSYLLSQNKINAYDVRLYTALGPQWVVGWKETN